MRSSHKKQNSSMMEEDEYMEERKSMFGKRGSITKSKKSVKMADPNDSFVSNRSSRVNDSMRQTRPSQMPHNQS